MLMCRNCAGSTTLPQKIIVFPKLYKACIKLASSPLPGALANTED